MEGGGEGDSAAEEEDPQELEGEQWEPHRL